MMSVSQTGRRAQPDNASSAPAPAWSVSSLEQWNLLMDEPPGDRLKADGLYMERHLHHRFSEWLNGGTL